ncbi:MAG: OmpA family protein [Rhodospirillales bacterium]|nr:OmpA family protein [Rhodospirillales bacterium]
MAVPSPAIAQDAPPAVQVDMSVLNAMQPAGDTETYYSKPVLTRKPYRGPNDDDGYYRKPTTIQQPVAEPFVSFPVTVKDRSEVIDPSLEKASDSVQEIREKVQKAAIDPPLPVLKPVPIASPRKTTGDPAPVALAPAPVKNVPLPPRRPAIQKASSSFVNKAQKQAVLMGEIKPSDIKMPAVPPQIVDAEPLQTLYSKTPDNPAMRHDQLARKLVEPDKKSMIKSVEAVTALANALMPTAAVDKGPKVIPASKPVRKNEVVERIEQAIDITAVEPAAGREVASIVDISETVEPTKVSIKAEPLVKPDEDQQDFISVRFTEGGTALDKRVEEQIGDKVLSRLKYESGLRVQIQSFASDEGKELQSARRTSLSRALSVRSYLLEQGIESRRIDVRALGMETDRTPADRIDFVFVDPQISK